MSSSEVWPAEKVADQLDDVVAITGPPLVMAHAWLHIAAGLAEAHSLSFCDASWAAPAGALGIPLVSADRQLLGAGLAQSPTEIAFRFGLV